ncbi:hypothetical protein UB45_04975 [Terrabacter sp. 28]|nr:hypothetical protein UB45_04975 [Terrabacter sp. 28]
MIEVTLASLLASAAVSQVGTLLTRWRERSATESDERYKADVGVLEQLLANYGSPQEIRRDSAHTDEVLRKIEATDNAAQLALALSPDRVFQDARARLSLVFRFNFAVCFAVSVILLGALAAAIVLALQGKTTLAIVFGGLSLGDILFAAAYQPLDRVNKAMVSTQRLDIIHLSTRERLSQSAEILDPAERLAETNRIWQDIKNDLTALADEG